MISSTDFTHRNNTNTMKRYFTLFLAAVTVLVSCGEKEPQKEPITLSVSPSEMEFTNEGGSQDANITSGIQPSIVNSNNWITVSQGTYANNSMPIKVSVRENTGTQPREGSISINGDKQTVKLTIRQNVKTYAFSISQTSASFGYEGGISEMTATSTDTPSATSSAAWVAASVGTISQSDHSTAISIIAGPNMGTEKRSATVTISYGSDSKTVSIEQDPMPEIKTASTDAKTPADVLAMLGMGWNLGNQMDANSNGIAGETLWGNSAATQATFNKVKEAGFSSVRIPVTYLGKFGEAPYYKIDEKWLDRVAELVGYAEKAGLKAIINIHHDGADSAYWLNIKDAASSTSKNEEVKTQFFSAWTQIANKFKDKGDFLIFEPVNEIQDGGWGWGANQSDGGKQYKVLNEWNQLFVKAVRATGGNNATRWLSTAGYSANPQLTIDNTVIPTDYVTNNRIMVAVHCYDPYDYTLGGKYTEWGHTAKADKSPSDKESAVVWVLDNLNKAYIEKGIPAYLGEMGCSFFSGEREFEFQKYYIEYFCKAAKDRTLPCFVWDNGAAGSGAEHHAYFDHGTGEFVGKSKDVVDRMIKAFTDNSPEYTLESVYNSAPYSE